MINTYSRLGCGGGMGCVVDSLGVGGGVDVWDWEDGSPWNNDAGL